MSSNADEAAHDRVSWNQQWQFTLKELRETLRDRRTIVTLLAMPLLLYPLLGIGLRFLAVQQSPAGATEFHIAAANDAEASWLRDAMTEAEKLLDREQRTSNQPDRQESPTAQPPGIALPGSDPREPSEVDRPVLKFIGPNNERQFNLTDTVVSGMADIGIRLATQMSEAPNRPPRTRIEIVELEGSTASHRAAEFVRVRIELLNRETLLQLTRMRDPQFQLPLQESTTMVGTGGRRATAILGLLPLILLLMTVTGGVYPAIDLTAGERERDTLETLMALPVPKSRLLLAKYAAVVTVTLLTGLMNLLAMTVTVYSLQLESALFGGDGLTFGVVFKLIITLTAFAGFFSAVLLLLTSFARSFKEAQALLIPMLMLSLAPGMIIMLPGWHLTAGTSVVPVINMLLLARDLFDGSAPLLPAIVAVVSTAFYACVALAGAARMFGSDAASTGSRGQWRELVARPSQRSEVPELTTIAFGLAVLFPLFFLASGLASREAGTNMSVRLMLSGLMTAVLFAGWPLALLTMRRVSFRSALAWRWPTISMWPALVLIGVSVWPWVFEIVVMLQSFGIGELDDAKRAQVAKLLEGWKSISLPLIVLSLGVIPGICEELFFRGFLFGGLRHRCSGFLTMVLTAAAFGLFHVILAGGAAPERVLPSTLMGLLLGWIRWRTDKLLPSMIVHVVHNSLLLTIAHYQEQLSGWSIGAVEAKHLPMWWLAVSAAGLLAGLILLRRTSSRS